MDRDRLLALIMELLTDHLLDTCDDNQRWEDCDPDIDGLRSQVADLIY